MEKDAVVRSIAFKVLGKPWTIRILSKKKYHKKHGKDSIAITMAYLRRIDMHPEGLDLESIVHELLHAYLGEICLKTTDLDEEQLEEVFAELLAKRGKELLSLADALHKKINS